MGAATTLIVDFKTIKHSGVVQWTLRREGETQCIANGAESNISKAKKQAEHATRMFAKQSQRK